MSITKANEKTEQFTQILEMLAKEADKHLAEEGITRDIIDAVDLDIEYEPVIAARGEKLCDAVGVRKMGTVYGVLHPMFRDPVDSESLKIMRARFLLAKAEQAVRRVAPLLEDLDLDKPEDFAD